MPATIQMVNGEVIDVTEDAEQVASKAARSSTPLFEVEAKDDNGEHRMWINPVAISSVM